MRTFQTTVTEKTGKQIDRLATQLNLKPDDLILMAIQRLLDSDIVDYGRCAYCGDLVHKSELYKSVLYKGKVCRNCKTQEPDRPPHG